MSFRAVVRPRFRFRFGKRTYDLSARTHIMGILNVTPDSFSDGGRFLDPERAAEHALRMIDDGADFIDVGGESTRPRGKSYGEGAEPVDEAEELRRVLPVIRRLAEKTDVPISIDTYKSGVAKEALAAGATIVNDVSGLHADRLMAETIAAAGASVVLMHMRGTPRTMEDHPRYANLFAEITASLEESIAWARNAGVGQIFIDPGIGFGKNLEQNLQILGNIAEFHKLGCPLLVGPSRKAFIGAILDLPVEERLEGTLGAAVALAMQGVHVVRLHDVKAAARALRVSDAIRMSSPPIME
jgi:dihydropteroate synthase